MKQGVERRLTASPERGMQDGPETNRGGRAQAAKPETEERLKTDPAVPAGTGTATADGRIGAGRHTDEG